MCLACKPSRVMLHRVLGLQAIACHVASCAWPASHRASCCNVCLACKPSRVMLHHVLGLQAIARHVASCAWPASHRASCCIVCLLPVLLDTLERLDDDVRVLGLHVLEKRCLLGQPPPAVCTNEKLLLRVRSHVSL